MTSRAGILLGLLIALLSRTPAMAQPDSWSTVRAAARVMLQRQPTIAPQVLRAKLLRQQPGMEVQVLGLDARSLLIATERGDQGEVFIVTRQAGRARIAWSAAADAAGARQADPGEAARLRALGSADGETLDASTATLIALAPDQGGAARFAINAVNAQAMGATATAHLSVWRWTGQAPWPLFAVSYAFVLSQDAPVTLVNGSLQIREKGQFETFIACGACGERRMLRTIALTDSGAEDRGALDLDPDLARLDVMLDRLLSGAGAGPNVDPRVVGRLRLMLARIRTQAPNGPVLGGLNGWTTRHLGMARTLCLATEQAGTLVFTLRGRGAATRVTAVRRAEGVGCEGR